jgi:hypothetical protein
MKKNIEPKYVTFEQAKWLKKIGFNEETWQSYRTIEHTEERLSWWKVGELNKPMYCKLSDHNNAHYSICSAPEQWQVVEWLRVNHGIWVEVIMSYTNKWEYSIYRIEDYKLLSEIHSQLNSPQEAYSAAFDYIKNKELCKY